MVFHDEKSGLRGSLSKTVHMERTAPLRLPRRERPNPYRGTPVNPTKVRQRTVPGTHRNRQGKIHEGFKRLFRFLRSKLVSKNV